MKVVIDTNVLVSGLISTEGPCGQIIGLVAEGLLSPCMDERMLLEYAAVLPRPEFGIDAGDVAALLEVLRENGETLTPAPLAAGLPHPADLPFLEVAAAVDAVLITGNVRHFPSNARAGVTVVTPREFLDSLRRE